MRLFHGLWVGALLALGCGGPGVTLPLTYDLPASEPRSNRLSLEVLLVADNQTQYLYGKPIWLRKGLFDKVAVTGIRSPELDLYGQDLLGWILDKEAGVRRGTVSIHLGDALNLSCTWEMDRFTRTMSAAKHPWFMALGNHDGYFFGSGRTGPGSSQAEWDAGCAKGGGPITKTQVIERYFGLLVAQGRQAAVATSFGGLGADPGLAAFAREADIAHEAAWSYTGNARALLRRVKWHRDCQYWRSYLIQELDITDPVDAPRPVRVILLDTSQFKDEPGLAATVIPGMYDAGASGFMLDNQLDVVRSWLEEDRKDNAVVVMMGHHPENVIGGPALAAMQGLRQEFGVELYVSAHTHSSAYFVYGLGESKQLELNIGSVLDFPAQYRTLTVLQEERSQRTVMRSPRRELWQFWQDGVGAGAPGFPNCEAKKDAWYPPDTPHNNYADYMKSNSIDSAGTERMLFAALLDSYARLLTVAPTVTSTAWPPSTGTDAAVSAHIATLKRPDAPLSSLQDFLLALDTFEANRTVQDEATRRDYRACQALWASTADKHKARIPEVDQWFIVFPPPTAKD
ncbi:MAG TPA: metallophosphoesterase [Polyangiaceae bacterium]|nr:metallophosphoesterase [Polyangiaceae bacterium]